MNYRKKSNSLFFQIDKQQNNLILLMVIVSCSTSLIYHNYRCFLLYVFPIVVQLICKKQSCIYYVVAYCVDSAQSMYTTLLTLHRTYLGLKSTCLFGDLFGMEFQVSFNIPSYSRPRCSHVFGVMPSSFEHAHLLISPMRHVRG